MNYTYIHKNTRAYILLLIIFFIGAFSGISQTPMSKIKDGTLPGQNTPPAGVILELESINKGFLTPRLTTLQRDAIIVANRSNGMLIFNTDTGCFNYWSSIHTSWLNLCGTPPPAKFTITNCSAIAEHGIYTQGTALNGNDNTLVIPVTVSDPGTYQIMATTTNGYYFYDSGTFPNAGNFDLILRGSGTPASAAPLPGDVVRISLNSVAVTCTTNIVVLSASVDYTLDCLQISPVNTEGTYMIGKILDGATNRIKVPVIVTATGYYSMATNTINGMSFRASGNFTTTGNQDVYLEGTGTPINAGTNTFTLTTAPIGTATVGMTCNNLTVTTQPVTYTIDCSANAPIIAGTYMQDVNMDANDTVTIKVNVQATGTTKIETITVDGFYFTSGDITFSTTGLQDVVLNGVGRPISGGNKTFTIKPTPGLTTTCSFIVPVNVQPIVYSLTCNSIVVAGNYAPNIAMNATNTMTLSVNVTYPGDYNITTNTVDGVFFAGNGTFTGTGTQNVILTAQGTTTIGGTKTFTITANSTSGNATCTKAIDFVFRKMNVLGLGGGGYQPASSVAGYSAKGLLTATNIGPNGTIKVNGINLVDGGTYQGTALKNLINNNEIDIIFIGLGFIPNSSSVPVLENFVKQKKGVIIHGQEGSDTEAKNMINAIANSPTTAVSLTGTVYTMPIVNTSHPVLDGPFKDLKGLYFGADVLNSGYVQGYSSEFTSLVNHPTNAARSNVLVHNTLGYMFVGDGGWFAGSATEQSKSLFPALMSTLGAPLVKTDYGDGVYGTKQTIQNSFFYLNTWAWAIKYAQENTNITYQIP